MRRTSLISHHDVKAGSKQGEPTAEGQCRRNDISQTDVELGPSGIQPLCDGIPFRFRTKAGKSKSLLTGSQHRSYLQGDGETGDGSTESSC